MFKINSKTIVLYLSFVVAISSCHREEYSNYEQIQLNQKNEKELGENLFRQVFFLQGGKTNILSSIPVYSYNIGKISELSPEQKQYSENFINEIVRIIKKNDQDYFQDFELRMRSKDPYIIDQTLKNSAQDIVTAIKKSSENERYGIAMKIYNEKYSSMNLNTDRDLDVLKTNIEIDLRKEMYKNNENYAISEEAVAIAAATAAVVVVVAWEAAATVNVVAAVTAFVWKYAKFFDVIEPYGSSNLTNDEVVATIVNNY